MHHLPAMSILEFRSFEDKIALCALLWGAASQFGFSKPAETQSLTESQKLRSTRGDNVTFADNFWQPFGSAFNNM